VAPGPVRTNAKNLAPAGIRSSDRPARNQSLYRLSTGCGRNSELIVNKNNILLKVIDTSFITSQFTVVLNFFFYIVSLFVCNVC
jgi:hypothetical protein